jgi:hypothetical protein
MIDSSRHVQHIEEGFLVKQFKHPATVVAALALFFALGGGAWASGLISGSKIKNHSIPAMKLTNSAVKSLHGQRGPTGPAGPKGDTGRTGPQGPGGTIVTYDATASASPPASVVGTFLGDTLAAQCWTTAGNAELQLALKTTDGSWTIDYTENYVIGGSSGGLETSSEAFPAGYFTTFQQVDDLVVNSGGHQSDKQVDFVQLGPAAGSMVWHETASTVGGTQSCHLSVQSFPETITKLQAAAHASPPRQGELGMP